MNEINDFLQQLVAQISLVETVVKGMIIGIVASAPMGPVGVLCIQRTLNKGRIKNGKAKKIYVMKYKSKKNEKKKIGHRQPYTKVQIAAIEG